MLKAKFAVCCTDVCRAALVPSTFGQPYLSQISCNPPGPPQRPTARVPVAGTSRKKWCKCQACAVHPLLEVLTGTDQPQVHSSQHCVLTVALAPRSYLLTISTWSLWPAWQTTRPRGRNRRRLFCRLCRCAAFSAWLEGHAYDRARQDPYPSNPTDCSVWLLWLQRAQEIQQADPKVAYYCRLYSLEQVMSSALPSRRGWGAAGDRTR